MTKKQHTLLNLPPPTPSQLPYRRHPGKTRAGERQSRWGHEAWGSRSIDPQNTPTLSTPRETQQRCMQQKRGHLSHVAAKNLTSMLDVPTVECGVEWSMRCGEEWSVECMFLIHISEPTRLRRNSYAVFCLKKKSYNSRRAVTVQNRLLLHNQTLMHSTTSP